jgi:hypothetical protein
MRIICAAVFCVLLAGCGTKYQEMGLTGGVSAQQITADTYRIVAQGNGFTQGATIKDYVLLKAAETAQSVGATHFMIVGAENTTKAETTYVPGTTNTTISGRTATTTTTPGYVDTVIKPGQEVMVRVLKPAPGQSLQGAFAAEEIIRFISPRVKRD